MSQASPTPPSAKPAPPPKPEPVRAKELAGKITSRFPAVKVEYMREKRLKVVATPDAVKDLSTFARDELGFDHLSVVSAVDWIAKKEFEVVYFVGCLSRPGFEDFVLAVSERVPRDDPVVPTLIGVWVGADYHERETHEMFGINFQGHPDNSHILLPEDWNDLPPLRKDYVSPGR
ncbi:MAG TPA: NADH-quinone oxidoreductase subunit C [Nitrososphaerales archaeon]|nr:NADH-quinone oxidoreductase subunit C [Nitrososphaerales archaeon]